jgi:hypothetical protein
VHRAGQLHLHLPRVPTVSPARSKRPRGGETLELIRTRTTYAVEVPRDKAIALFDLEPVSLLDRLMKVDGVSEVNYDGHFGPFVYVTIDADDDTPATHAAVRHLIQSCLDGIRGRGPVIRLTPPRARVH